MPRGFGDLVPMPLPNQWGPTVIPPGASTSAPPLPAGAQIGWQQVSGGWILAVRLTNGNVAAYPGATVVPYPGAQNPPPGNGSGSTSDETAGYFGSDPGSWANAGGNPASEPGQGFWGTYPGGGLPGYTGQLRVPLPTVGASAPWGRAPVLPDSMLPPALQRNNPLLRHQFYRANGYDRMIWQDAARWAYIRAHGGLKSCCRIPELGAPIWDNPPWLVQPSQGEKVEQMYSLPISAFQLDGAFTGNDVVLGQWVVPNGYDGAINRFVCSFTGDGFLDFRGLIFWRVKVGNRFARNLGNVQNTFGDFKTAFSVPGSDNIRLVSQQTITLIANVPVGSPVSDGVIAAGTFGWVYPRR